MTDDSAEDPDIVHYFVDEAGHPVLVDGKGRVGVLYSQRRALSPEADEQA